MVINDNEEATRRADLRRKLEATGEFSLVGRHFLNALEPGDGDPRGVWSARSAAQGMRQDPDLVDELWDWAVFTRDPPGAKNNYQALMCANWACFSFLPAWLRAAAMARLNDFIRDADQMPLLRAKAFEQPISTQWLDRRVGAAATLLECADQLTIGPLEQLRRFDRNPRLLKKVERAQACAEDFYSEMMGPNIRRSREVDDRVVDKAELAWANVAAAAESSAERSLRSAGLDACQNAILRGRKEAGAKSIGWATLGLRCLTFSSTFARAIALQEARRVATAEDLRFFTPVGDIPRWEEAALDPSTSIGTAVSARLRSPGDALRAQAFSLVVEMYLQTGHVEVLFNGTIGTKAKQWDEDRPSVKQDVGRPPDGLES